MRTMKAEELTSADPAVRHADSFSLEAKPGSLGCNIIKRAVNIGLAIWNICLAIGWVLGQLAGLAAGVLTLYLMGVPVAGLQCLMLGSAPPPWDWLCP